MFWNKNKKLSTSTNAAPSRSPLALSLEPRMLFDGAVAATVADAAQPDATQAATGQSTDNQVTDSHDATATTPPAATTDQRQEIVFVDGKLQDAQALIAGLPGGTEVVVLDSNKDGLQQIADYLKGREGVDAIHLLSHGAEGTVELGNTWLNSQNIGQHAEQLNAIGAALATDGDILIYGCDTGEGAQGATLLSELARLTQADVAASDDATGAANKDGDWVLESRTGQVESQSLQVTAYNALLAAPADENYDDDASGTVFNSNTFDLDGIRYVLTGTGTYETSIEDGGTSPGVNNGLLFDFSNSNPDGIGGLTSVTISAADGSAFNLAGISFLIYDLGIFGSSSNVTLTTSSGETLGPFAPNGSIGNLQHLDLSGNTDFQNITSFTFSGTNLILEIDNLNFEAAIPPSTAPSLSATAVNPTFIENGSAVDLFSTITAATNDSGQTFSGAALTVTNVSNGTAEILSIGGTDIALSNGNSGTITGIGNYSVSVAAGTATITLTGMTRDNTQMGTLIDGITYRNTSDDPGSANRVVTITQITDSGGSNSTATPNIASTVTITAVNDFPTVANAIPNQNATEDAAYNFQFATNTFNDVDAGALTYTAQLAGGGALPAWLSFDALTRTFSGTPLNAHVGTLSIDVIANDGNGANITDTFNIVVANTNDAPTVANATPDQNASEDTAFSFQFAANTFSDVDAGATLTYTAQLAGGGLLPAWLSFDPVTRTFSGTPSNANVGALSIDLIANDGNGGSVTDTFDIVVANTNDAPTLANAIANQNASEDTAFNFQFAANTFSDVDAGATLTYTAQLAGGGLLPAWLSFDPVTRTFSGTPSSADAGTLSIEVTANDGNGGSVSDTFDMVVSAVNDAPVITAPPSIAIFEDEPGDLSGISFSDVDAGTSPVTVTLSVPSGSLSATSAAGVTVGGTSSAMTLTGSISDINTFISAAGVVFTTASSVTSDVTLTIEINDGGNSGSGGALTDSTTVSLDVTAVNDAPVNSIPAAQSVDQDVSLVFSSGNGNQISIGDVDASANSVEVTLSVTNGVLTLAGTAGLSFTTGDGTADSSLVFSGSIASINAALATLTYSPTSGYNGAAVLSITTSDLGSSGSGGTQTDTDNVNITVNSLNPRITDVSASTPDGSYKVGDTITITTTFNQAVTVDTTGGTPTLLLETGLTDRIATYVSGSGSNTLTFSYTVQPGDLSADLDYQSTAALSLNGATIQNITADNAVLTLPTPGTAGSLAANEAIVIDGVAATVSSVSVPANGVYVAGDNLDFTVNLSENVTVDTSGGTPRIAITLDTGGTAYASYLSGSGTSALVFRLTVVSGQMDSNGISLGSSIDANGGTLRDTAGNNSTTTLSAVGSTTGVLVDAVAPQIDAISLDVASPTNASSVTFTVTFTEDVSGVDISDFSLATSGSVSATLQSLTQIDPRTYQVMVDTITGLGSLGLNLNANGTAIIDSVNNAIVGAFTGQAYAIGIPVLEAPSSPQLASSSDSGISNTDSITNDSTPTLTGTAQPDSTVILYDSDGITVLGTAITNGSGNWSITASSLSEGTHTLTAKAVDSTGNASAASAGLSVVVDTVAPTATSVSIPASSTYVAGQNLDFTVNLSESLIVDTSGGTPRIAISLDTGGTAYASYLSGSGSDALVFRFTVASGQLDSDGISLSSSIDPNGGTLRDAAGNDSITMLGAMGSTAGLLIDAVAPQIDAISLDVASPTNASSVTFTVTFTEDVSGVDISDFSLATSGSVNGTLQSLTQLDPRTYQVTVSSITGLGNLGLNLNAGSTGIIDRANNTLAGAFSGQAYTIGIPTVVPTPDVTGDPEFRANPPSPLPVLPPTTLQPTVSFFSPSATQSPFTLPPLFEQPTLGSGLPPVGNIFISNGALAPSFIAQVFASRSTEMGGDGSGNGFLGFGGGDGGVFGSSSLSNIFGQDSLQETEQLEVFDGKKWGSTEGSQPGTLGAPTLGQQLHELHEAEQRQVRELAQALEQFEKLQAQA